MTQTPLLEATTSDSEPYTILLARDVTKFELDFWIHNRTIGPVNFWKPINCPAFLRESLWDWGLHLAQFV